MWNKQQIRMHILACKLLNNIKNSVFKFIRKNKNVSEHEVQQFILKEFRRYKLKNEIDSPIVAFNEDSSFPHFYPKTKSKRLRKNAIIMIDIWAKNRTRKSPYADITWMAYCGKISKDAKNAWEAVVEARNTALRFIEAELSEGKMPVGSEINEIAQGVLLNKGYEKAIRHGTGHSLGFVSPHGFYGHINSRNKKHLKKNIGYTIEPGVYLSKKFGVRSEINFYIDENMKLIITTLVQKHLVKI